MPTSATQYQQLIDDGQFDQLEQLLRRRRGNGGDKVLLWSALGSLAQDDPHAAYRYLTPVAQRQRNRAMVQGVLGKIGDALQLPTLRQQGWQAAVNAEPDLRRWRSGLARYYRDMGNTRLGLAVLSTLRKTRAASRRSKLPLPQLWPAKHTLASDAVVVLLPVYDGVELTQACLASIAESMPHNQREVHLLLINDASPSPVLVNYLQVFTCISGINSVELVENSANQGFIHTVNAGLRRYPDHDYILLNADTLVHGDWVDRLHRSAYPNKEEAPVAAVSPLSNFGELVSFPRSMHNTVLQDGQMAAKIDAIARTVNTRESVEIPVGVGFCLYVRAAVIKQVGVLDWEHYDRGYGEEVDWCLRMRRAGYRVMCATNVFVAHRGNVSFKAEKPILAARNLRVLHRRYPQHSAEYDHFLASDPLASARQAIEAQLLHDVAGDAQLVAGQPEHPDVLALRHRAAVSGQAIIMLYRDDSHRAKPWRLLVDGEIPLENLFFESQEDAIAQLEAANLPAAPQLPGISDDDEPDNTACMQIARDPAKGDRKSVVAVLAGDDPLGDYPLIAAVAHYIAVQDLPIHLWLQYTTLNDMALVNLGSVTAGTPPTALDKATHYRAGGVTALWQPEAACDYQSGTVLAEIVAPWKSSDLIAL